MAGFLGIDLAGTERTATTCAFLAPGLASAELAHVYTDAELRGLALHYRPDVIAVDAPLGLPEGWACLETPCACGRCQQPQADLRRRCEVELRRWGIACYWTTRRSIIKGMVYRALTLAPQLAAAGAQVIEVYPFGSKVRLWGRPLPKKTTPQGAVWYDARVRALLPPFRARPDVLTHDEVDAALAAYTAWLYATGRGEALGLAAEGQIVLPVAGV